MPYHHQQLKYHIFELLLNEYPASKIERYGKELDVDIEGAGLGLFISKEIVQLHEGQIWVESEGRNKGATFIVKLPIF